MASAVNGELKLADRHILRLYFHHYDVKPLFIAERGPLLRSLGRRVAGPQAVSTARFPYYHSRSSPSSRPWSWQAGEAVRISTRPDATNCMAKPFPMPFCRKFPLTLCDTRSFAAVARNIAGTKASSNCHAPTSEIPVREPHRAYLPARTW